MIICVVGPGAGVDNSDEVAKLLDENAKLKKEIEELRTLVGEWTSRALRSEVESNDGGMRGKYVAGGPRKPLAKVFERLYGDALRRCCEHAVKHDPYWETKFRNDTDHEKQIRAVACQIMAQFPNDYLEDKFWEINQKVMARAMHQTLHAKDAPAAYTKPRERPASPDWADPDPGMFPELWASSKKTATDSDGTKRPSSKEKLDRNEMNVNESLQNNEAPENSQRAPMFEQHRPSTPAGLSTLRVRDTNRRNLVSSEANRPSTAAGVFPSSRPGKILKPKRQIGALRRDDHGLPPLEKGTPMDRNIKSFDNTHGATRSSSCTRIRN